MSVFLAPSPPEPNPNLYASALTTLHQSQVGSSIRRLLRVLSSIALLPDRLERLSLLLITFVTPFSLWALASLRAHRFTASFNLQPPARRLLALPETRCLHKHARGPALCFRASSLAPNVTNKDVNKLPHTSTPRRHSAQSPIAQTPTPPQSIYPFGHLGLGRRFAVKEMFAVKEQSRA